MASSIRQKFYNLFWSNPSCQEIFLLHKEELLKKEKVEFSSINKHYYQKRFVLSNSLKRPDAILRIEQRLQDRTIDLNTSLQHKSDKNFPDSKITEYFNTKWGKSIELVSKKFNGNGITRIRFVSEFMGALASEKRFIRFLQRYEVVPPTINSFNELIQSVDRFVEKELQQVLKSEHFSDVMTAVDEIANLYSNYNYNNLLESHQFYTDVLYDKDNFKDRLSLFDSLYECRVLEGGIYKAYYECTHCNIDVFSGSVTLNVTPGKVKLKCPNCAKEVFYLAPYRINEEIFSDIISKDGLIMEAVSQLLNEHKIPHIKNPLLGSDIELDIQVYSKQNQVTDVIELKMFKSDRPEEVLMTNMKEGFRKLISAREKLLTSNLSYRNVRFHYLSNLSDDILAKDLKISFKEQINGYPFTIHTLESMHDFIESISNRS